MSRVKHSCSARRCFSSVKILSGFDGDVLYLDTIRCYLASPLAYLSIDTFVFFPRYSIEKFTA